MNATHSMPQLVTAQARYQESRTAHPFQEVTLPDGEPWATLYRDDAGYLVRFFELVDFSISANGEELVAHPVPGVSAQTLEHLYLNQALPLALSLQKKLVLHGSAVEIGGRAIAFIGQTGRGKSTLAASFSSHDFRFLSDDGLVIDKTGDEYFVRPSHPSIRLWEDSLESLSLDSTRLAPAIDYNSKLRFLADDSLRHCAEARRLGPVYFLGDGSSPRISITAVSGSKPVIEMIQNCFLLGVDEHEMLTHNFEQLADLSRRAIFFRLDYPRRFDILDQVRETIIQHTQSRTS